MTARTWDIIGKRRWGYAFSLLLVIPGVIALIANSTAGRGALDWGVDFTGGNFFQLEMERPFTTGQVRAVADRFATGQSVIQKEGKEVLIRTRPLTPEAKSGLLAALKQEFGKITILREDEVGPKIGRELRNIAIIGVLIGLALQVLYVSYRFKSFRFALAADIALLHDLLVVVGIFAITRKEVNSAFVAVLLTVVGYSINDTIVVFDRIRENLAMRGREAFDRLVNRSLLEALVRSINTVLTTIMAIGAIYVFGGSTVRDFAFGLMAGIIVGAYSSVFTASAVLVDWYRWAERRGRRPRAEPVVPALAEAVATPDPAALQGAGNSQRRRRPRRR